VPTNTHSHQVLPLTRAEVSSGHTTALAITQAPAVAAAASNGSCARASMLLVAPSLPDARAPSGMASGIERPNGSSVSAASRSSPMAWA
jgi:hypothetical protein